MTLAARRYFAFWDNGDAALARAALAPEFVDHTLPPGRPQGPDGPLFASEQFRRAVPDIYRIAGGRIVEDWHLEDNLTLLQQLGVVAAS